jgi:RNA-directed DNA polymerase
MTEAKPFDIPKSLVWDAYKKIKSNKGAAGIDGESLEEFDKNRNDNLYRLWNRLSSGSYFPPPVMGVAIPKKSGGTRLLGIPTVSDRIAQQVVKTVFEPTLEKHFHPDSYGYRPGKSAHQVIEVTRRRCWRYDWVLEFDIRALFDNLDHELLMKAVKVHTQVSWILLYIERWLKAPMSHNDKIIARDNGTP